MKFSDNVRSISYVKAHASELISNISEAKNTIVITQNGKAKAVLQDTHTYEETQDTLAMLKLIAQSSKDIDKGKVKPFRKAFSDIKKQISRIAENGI